MAMRRADTDAASLATGAKMAVVSDDRVVRVVTADRLSIETSNGHRLSAVVADRLDDAPAGPDLSRQLWVVN